MGIAKLTTEEYKEKVYKKYKDKIQIISEFNGGSLPIKYLYNCEKHGMKIGEVHAKNLLNSHFAPCKECTRELKSEKAKGSSKKDKTFLYNKLIEYVKSKGGVLITKEWTTAKALYEVKCQNPDHPAFFASADNLVNKPQWCPYCSGRCGDFQKEMDEIAENKNGTILSKYHNSHTYIKVKCNLHNYIWDVTPQNLRKGRWCPICNLPYSEKVVYDYLVENTKYNIRVQYTFPDLFGKNNQKMPFDFALLNEDILLGIIEVDDDEHRHNHDNCLRRQIARERDIIKNKYCQDNKIKLFRMPYTIYGCDFKNYNWYYNYINLQLQEFIKSLKNNNGERRLDVK